MKKTAYLEITRILFISMFVFVVFSKWFDFHQYRYEINSQPFPNTLTPVITWTIPLLELAAVIFLLFNRTMRAGYGIATGIMTLFTVYASAILLHAFAYIPCECGGIIKGLSWQQHLVFNLCFLLMGISGFFLSKPTNISFNTNKNLYRPVTGSAENLQKE